MKFKLQFFNDFKPDIIKILFYVSFEYLIFEFIRAINSPSSLNKKFHGIKSEIEIKIKTHILTVALRFKPS